MLEVIKLILINRRFQHIEFLQIISCLQLFVFLGYCFFAIYFGITRNLFQPKKRFLIGIFSFVTIIILLEILSVFLLKNPSKLPVFVQPAFANYYLRYNRSLMQYDRGTIYDSSFFYMLKADTTFAFDNIEFHSIIHTNAKGLRDNNTSLVQPQVICLGDSYTVGWGVNEGEPFPDRLEKLTGLNVLNAGVSSFGTAREITLLDHLDTSSLKYLIIQYCDNDLPENEEYIKNNYKLPISSRFTYDSIVVQQSFNRKYFPGKVFLSTLLDFLRSQKTKIKSLFAKNLSAIDRVNEGRLFLDILLHSKINFNKTTVIVTFLDAYDSLSNPFINKLQRLVEQNPYKQAFSNNLRLLNLSSLVSKKDYYILDDHLKASGHQKVANALWRVINKNY